MSEVGKAQKITKVSNTIYPIFLNKIEAFDDLRHSSEYTRGKDISGLTPKADITGIIQQSSTLNVIMKKQN